VFCFDGQCTIHELTRSVTKHGARFVQFRVTSWIVVFQPKGVAVKMSGIPSTTTDWSKIERTEHKGESGSAYWRTQQFGDVRVRMVEYTPGYLADHWCVKGHILLCLDGELQTEFKDGRKFTLNPGMSYQVADNAEPHRSRTEVGAKLFIVD
jgi:hypothetical protein